jgi:phosphomannomutase
MVINPKIFRDYDVRGVVPEQLDGEGAKRIGKVLAEIFKPKQVAVGNDMRITADQIAGGLKEGLLEQGVDVTDLGLISTDMAYYAAGKHNFDLAIAVSASHNPSQYNGFKIVKKGAVAVSGNSGIYDIRDYAVSDKKIPSAEKKGKLTYKDLSMEFVCHCLSLVNVDKLKKYKVVVDAGNAMAGHIIPKLALFLPIDIIPLYFALDGTFPNHIPNPLLPEAQKDLRKKVLAEDADFGIAFDGDGDRMYLMDETGRLVSGTITTAMLAEAILKKHPRETILYNAVTGRVVPEVINNFSGKGKRVRVGHTLIKEAMRKNKAYFAGEHSGHYYFRQNYYADSAFAAMLFALELISKTNKPLSKIIAKYDKYPKIPETNFEVENKQKLMERLEDSFKNEADKIDWLDGVSIWFKEGWANIRPSNTQPLLRLNVEADNKQILEQMKNKFVKKIKKLGGKPATE